MLHSGPPGHPPRVILHHSGNLYARQLISLFLDNCVGHLGLLQHDLANEATVASDVGIGNIRDR